MFLGYLQYGPSVAIRAVGRDDYWLQMPVRGKLEVVSGRNSVVCNAERAAIVSPTHLDYYQVNSGEGCGGIRLCFYKSALIDCLVALMGDLPNKPLAFSEELNLMEGGGRSIAQSLLLAIRDFDRSDTTFWNGNVMASFQQFLMTALLTSQPHNFSKALKRLEMSIAPRDVKRAVDYIQAHFDMQVTISDIVKATGVPGRTLFKQFKDHKGISPMQYLCNVRFERVRKSLLDAEPETGVTKIATAAGFSHMGRFAIEYRKRFGESPSSTLRRQRNG
jgi:AraC-like DNA-binding protein